MINTIELENYLIRFDEINMLVIPARILDAYNNNIDRGVPTGIGWHRSVGWFVLETLGQGPVLIESQFEYDVNSLV